MAFDCRLSTLKVPNGHPIVAFQLSKYRMAIRLSPFNFESTLFLYIVQFQLQNHPILIYCPVSTSKLPYSHLLSSFKFKTSLFLFIVQFQVLNHSIAPKLSTFISVLPTRLPSLVPIQSTFPSLAPNQSAYPC